MVIGQSKTNSCPGLLPALLKRETECAKDSTTNDNHFFNFITDRKFSKKNT